MSEASCINPLCFSFGYPLLAGELGLDEVIVSGIQSLSNSDQIWFHIFVPKLDSADWVAILLQYSFTLPTIIQCKYWIG